MLSDGPGAHASNWICPELLNAPDRSTSIHGGHALADARIMEALGTIEDIGSCFGQQRLYRRRLTRSRLSMPKKPSAPALPVARAIGSASSSGCERSRYRHLWQTMKAGPRMQTSPITRQFVCVCGYAGETEPN